MRKIFVHGLSALDLIHTVSDLPKYAEKYKSNSVYVSIGGNAANASVALSRLGIKVFLSTVIGNDEVGNILKQKLLSENIDLSYTHYVDNFKTSISSIIIDKNGERLVLNNREFNDVAIKNNIDFEIFDGIIKNIPAIKIKAVDTLAAGDVWHGAFLFELVKKSSLVNSIKFANYIASLKCKKFGGSSGSPFLYEINENVVL